MSHKMTERELAIVSAIAAEAIEALKDGDIPLAVEIVEDRIQFLVDAELIEVDEDSEMVRTALHVALDAVLDAIAEGEDCDEDEDEESEEDEDEDEDSDEDSEERAY